MTVGKNGSKFLKTSMHIKKKIKFQFQKIQLVFYKLYAAIQQ